MSSHPGSIEHGCTRERSRARSSAAQLRETSDWRRAPISARQIAAGTNCFSCKPLPPLSPSTRWSRSDMTAYATPLRRIRGDARPHSQVSCRAARRHSDWRDAPTTARTSLAENAAGATRESSRVRSSAAEPCEESAWRRAPTPARTISSPRPSPMRNASLPLRAPRADPSANKFVAEVAQLRHRAWRDARSTHD